MKKNKLISKLCLVLALAAAMSLSCVPVFASATDITAGDSAAQIESVPPAIDPVDADGSESAPADVEVIAINEDGADVGDAAEPEVGTDGSVDNEPVATSDTSTDDADKDKSEAESDNGETAYSRTRYMITGGIILVIGIGFYVFLSVKTKKKH